MTFKSINVSYSSLSTWLNCKRQWYYRYKRNLAPVVEAHPLLIGSAVHSALEYALRLQSEHGLQIGIDEWIKSTANNVANEGIQGFLTDLNDGNPVDMSDIVEIPFMPEEALPIAQRMWKAIYFDEWETATLPDGTLGIEVPFTAKLVGGSNFVGRIDWIAKERFSGALFIWEFKTRKTLTPPEDEEYDLQKTLYQHVMHRRYGLPIAGSITLQGLTKNPRVPKLNKNGTMDRRPIVTTWDIYRNALIRNGLNPIEYRDIEDKLRDVEFVRLDRSYRSAEYCDNVWKQTVMANVTPMRSAIGVTALPSINPMHCKRCPFAELCKAELNGYDAAYVESTQYKSRT